MTISMLIDGTQPEETRVAVVKNNRLEEFDYENVSKVQLKGNVYLAKITRVEPSLQAAFVEYGGGRNGFLAFSEIHPDYYQIPVADRQAILDAQLAEQALAYEKELLDSELNQTNDPQDIETHPDDLDREVIENNDSNKDNSDEENSNIDSKQTSENDELEQLKKKSTDLLKSYKIQEVTKKGQIILVQVTKEERGNKGAALTTYISLAGRYCVLMPNTARGGGISRKISNNDDRKKIKEIVDSLDIPRGMALIIRTAGAERTKTELKKDYEYLFQLWENIRENTLVSIAPKLVHEEGNLIKKSFRDIYSKETDQVLIQGTEAYKAAKQYMKLLLPSHAKKVQQFKEDVPIFNHFKVNSQLDTILERRVDLKSGGHLIIDSTEALVAIDVNSGRATKERNIEETALKTNIEAAEETARQLKLRDLAGLIVIDFIDMHDYKNNRSVERKLRDSLKTDRARIQIGRISTFGLLEMSRQRLRTSLIEANTEICIKCRGTGIVRSIESSSLKVLRAIEEESQKGNNYIIKVDAPNQVALYLLNYKRTSIQNFEVSYNVEININTNSNINPPDFHIERIIKNSEQQLSADSTKNESNSEDTSKNIKRRRRGKRGGKKKKIDDDLKVNNSQKDEKSNRPQNNSKKIDNTESDEKPKTTNTKNKQNVKKKPRKPQKTHKRQPKAQEDNSDDSKEFKNMKSIKKNKDGTDLKKSRKTTSRKIKDKKNQSANEVDEKTIDDKNSVDNKNNNETKRVGWWSKN
ncbi:MAG: Ribonuclease E [Alphaproteobacteria bacterium MarineAlpha2_Bin1]|nr:MAG: Ribonuclease E [Alphaproteobacteria bacterium MarineAlpha2_Bin1]